MATLQDYLGITALRDAWPKWKANVIAINNQVINHVAGSADKHAAQDITYTGDFVGKTEVKAALDQAKTEIDTIVVNASIDPEVAFARDSTVKGETFDTLDARLEESEQDLVTYKADNALNVKAFGAIGDGVADDTSSIQEAANYINSLASDKKVLYFPAGKYIVTDTIVFTDTSGLMIKGEIGWHSSEIAVDASLVNPISSVIKFSGTAAKIFFVDIEIDGTNKALSVIDADEGFDSGMSYSSFDRVTISGVRKGGYGINGLGYVVNLFACDIKGYGAVRTVDDWRGVGVRIIGSSNGVQILNCNIRRLDNGILNDDTSRTINIKDSVFDSLAGAAIISLHGVYQLNIEGNYFESCGGTPLTIPVLNKADSIVDAVIILSQENHSYIQQVKNSRIVGNHFTGSKSASIIALNTALYVKVSDNSVLTSADVPIPLTSFIHLFGWGATYLNRGIGLYSILSESNSLLKDLTPLVTKILSWEVALAISDNSFSNIIIRDSLTLIQPILPTNLISKDPLDMDSAGYAITLASIVGGKKTYKLVGTGLPYKWIALDNLAELKGRYVRLSWTEEHTTASRPLRVLIRDGVTTSTAIYSYAVGEHSFNVLFYIDPLATAVEIQLAGISMTGIEVFLSNLQLCLASHSLEVYQEISSPELLKSPDGSVWKISVDNAGAISTAKLV